MTAFSANGNSYDTDDLVGNNGYGYNVPTVAGDGGTYPLAIAMMIDLRGDAAQNMVSTSTSSVAVGTGSKTFVLAADLPVIEGMYGFAFDNAAPTTNWMFFQVDTFTSATKTIDVTVTASAGSGTLSNWDMFLGAGPQGATGPTGSANINGETAITQVAQADEYVVYDASAAGNRKITHENTQKQASLELRYFM